MAERKMLRNFTKRGRPKGATVAATALRDVKICRVLATGLSLRKTAKMFGVTHQTVINARYRQRRYFILREREKRDLEALRARRTARS